MSDYQYESIEQLNEALSGEYGEEIQADAEDFALENDLEVVDDYDYDEDPDTYDEFEDSEPDDLALVGNGAEAIDLDALADKLVAIERELGDELTVAEQYWLAERPIDTIDGYVKQLESRRSPDRDSDHRRAMMLERANDAIRHADDGSTPERDEVAGPDETNLSEEGTAQRRRRMAAAMDVALGESGGHDEADASPAGLAAIE